MSKESNVNGNSNDMADTVSYDMYIISNGKLYKKDNNGDYKIVEDGAISEFKGFKDDNEVCEFLKGICKDLGYKTENMVGGGNELSFSDEKTVTVTDNTNPLAILGILKCLGFKTFKVDGVKYIQSCKEWDNMYKTNKDGESNEETKAKRENLINFLQGCVDFINRNLGLLNDFSKLLEEPNNSETPNVSQELANIRRKMEEQYCEELKKMMEDNKNVENININELGEGVEAIVKFISMMRNNTQGPQTGGFRNNNLFNNKCGDRFIKVLNNMSPLIGAHYVNELKNNINNLNKNAKSLNKKINQIAGGNSDCDYNKLGEKIQKQINETTSLSHAFYKLLEVAKSNGINPEMDNITMPEDVATVSNTKEGDTDDEDL